jgi:hypothetical protein
VGAREGQNRECAASIAFRCGLYVAAGFIQPLDGIRSKRPAHRVIYALSKPFTPLLRVIFPNHIVDTSELGRAMRGVSKHGYRQRILEVKDIRAAIPVDLH